MEFTQSHEESLTHSPWHAAIHASSSTAYLFKFACDVDDLSCCFMMTDTKRVWVEALANRHIYRRSRRLRIVDSDEDLDDDLSNGSRSVLPSLINLHSLRFAASLDMSILPSETTDLLVRFSSDELEDSITTEWQWELEALPRARGSDILSSHLIMPILGWSGIMLDTEGVIPQDESEVRTLEKKLDASGRTATRHLHRLVASVVGQPAFSTSLRRWTETVQGTGSKSTVFVEAEDEPESALPLPPPSKPVSIPPSPKPDPTPSKSVSQPPKRKSSGTETETELEDNGDAQQEDARMSSSPAQPPLSSSPPPPAEPSPPSSPAPSLPGRAGKGKKRTRSVASDEEDDGDADEEKPKPKTAAPAQRSRVKIKRSKY